MCNFEKWIFVFICPLDEWYLPFVSEQKGDIGFVMETWHGPAVPYSSLNSGRSLHFSFLTHFISPKSGNLIHVLTLLFLTAHLMLKEFSSIFLINDLI